MKPEHAASSFRTCRERRRRVHPSAFLPAATGALFALHYHAEASIIYSGIINASVGPIVGYPSARITQGVPIGGSSFQMVVERVRSGGNVARAVVVGPSFLHPSSGIGKLAAGAIISVGGNFNHYQSYLAIFDNGVQRYGSWLKGQVGYAGFQLGNGDLGWVRLEWTSTDGNPGPNEITALDWAYETIPGKSIQAGQTSSVPEPGTTALLALAGSGAAFLRRKRERKG